jgi:Fe-Mn family superoxide dismutase
MRHRLPELPYSKNALEPFISAETMTYHHDKHHRGYIDQLNQLVAGTPMEALSLEETILKSDGPVFNQAAQAWNHEFFWNGMDPERQPASGRVQELVEVAFGTFETFTHRWIKEGTHHFGSGWLWLVEIDGELKIEATPDAENPLKSGKNALLTCDLWEHAYYIDYRNERTKYLESFLELVNWRFVESRLTQSQRLSA